MSPKGEHLGPPSWSELHEHWSAELDSVNIVAPPRSTRILAGVFLFALFAIVIALVTVPWVQTVSGSGRVIAYSPSDRQQDLQAPVDGRIERWYVDEGVRVSAGDPIVDIADMDPNIMDRLQTEREALETKLQAAQKSLSTSKINFDRQRMLWNQGLSARRAYELAELEYAKFLGDVSTASAELARIETKIARQASQSVVAMKDGIVQRIIAPQGGVMVKQGDKLAVIVPESSDSAVELYVTGNDVPLLSVGRPVRLQFEGWPAVQFSGWPSVAVGTFPGRVGVVDPSDDGKGNFRVIIFPDGKSTWPESRYLRQGTRVLGWVLLEEVRLGWELWRRFNAFPLSQPAEPSPDVTISGKPGKK